MEVTFNLTKEDVGNYGRYVAFSISKFKRRFIMNVIMVPLLVGAIGYVMNFSLASYLLYGITLTFFYIYVLNSVIKSRIVKANSVKGGPLGEHTVELSAAGIKESFGEREEQHLWENIMKVVQDKKYIYLFWSITSAHVIPKRAFSGEEDVKAFFSYAENNSKSIKK